VILLAKNFATREENFAIPHFLVATCEISIKKMGFFHKKNGIFLVKKWDFSGKKMGFF
jgi:hypothetical protein